VSRHALTRPPWLSAGLDRTRLVVQSVFLLLLLLAALVAVVVEARHDAQTRARDQVLGVARTVAASPFVRSAAVTDDPPLRLGPYAAAVRETNDVDFVVVMDRDRTRWTHPDPRRVGQQFAGAVEPALRGETFTETFDGEPDASVRAVSPVLGEDGEVVAMVAVGTSTQTATDEVRRRLPWLLLVALAAAALAYGGEPLARWLDFQRLVREYRSSARRTDA
jgi:two-component system, CitB family, sensor kinase